MNSSFLPEDLLIVQEMLIGAKEYFICTGFTELKEYDKNAHAYTDKRYGTKVEVVIPKLKYARLFVQIPIGFDNLLVYNAKIRFDGFEAHFYRDFNTGEYLLTAKASAVTVVQ